MPSIRVSPETYKGLKLLIKASYANNMSAVIERFLREEGILSYDFQKHLEQHLNKQQSFSEPEQKEIINELGDLVCKYRYQRTAMRKLFNKYNGNKQKIITAYIWLEENTYISRKNNRHRFSSKYYAETLYNDGIKKGWIKK